MPNDSVTERLSTLLCNEQDSLSANSTIISNAIDPSANRRALLMLQRLSEKHGESMDLGPTLGTGGMGVIRLARQSDLGREVAVKTLRPERRQSESAMLSMLREAWVTGTLEHPNIVPVYYVDMDDEGHPQIILKRIEGVVWSKLLDNKYAVAEEFGTSDLLDWNLGVLESIVNAVRYAHSRGVIHRDLKPDNIMIGTFGEVYLLDWGIAVSMTDDGETLLPIADNLGPGIVGTPAYMPPEMLGDAPVDQRTDVYLLGAILFRILSGTQPHQGPEIEKLVRSIRRSKPEIPMEAPDGLAAICRKAMAADPNARFASVEEFGRSIVEYRVHHTSFCLSTRASTHLERLRERAKAGESSEMLQKTFGQCQFGFQSALEAWPDNSEASFGLQESIELVAQVEMSQGNPGIALRMLRELDSPNEELVLNAKMAARAITQAGEEMDTEIGTGIRLFLLIMFGFGWTWIEVWAYFAESRSNASHTLMLVTSTIYLCVVLVLLFLGRNALKRTLVNRQFSATLVIVIVSQLLISASGQALELTSEQVFVIWMLIWTVAISVGVATIENRMWPTALAFATCFIVTSFSMELRLYGMTGFTIVLIVNGVIIWAPKKNDGSEESNS